MSRLRRGSTLTVLVCAERWTTSTPRGSPRPNPGVMRLRLEKFEDSIITKVNECSVFIGGVTVANPVNPEDIANLVNDRFSLMCMCGIGLRLSLIIIMVQEIK